MMNSPNPRTRRHFVVSFTCHDPIYVGGFTSYNYMEAVDEAVKRAMLEDDEKALLIATGEVQLHHPLKIHISLRECSRQYCDRSEYCIRGNLVTVFDVGREDCVPYGEIVEGRLEAGRREVI